MLLYVYMYSGHCAGTNKMDLKTFLNECITAFRMGQGGSGSLSSPFNGGST